MNTKSKVVLGILGAAAAGVVIGMLLAPEKGKETRKKLRKTAEDWADSVRKNKQGKRNHGLNVVSNC
jgi:gas vesicle protein